MFWEIQRISCMQDDKFNELIDEGKYVHVHRATISSAEGTTVHLKNGAPLPSDGIILATGWSPSQSQLFDPSEHANLGLPIPVDSQPTEYKTHWDSLHSTSDAKVLSLF